VPPGAPLRDKSSEINEDFFEDLMKRFNEFLERKRHSILEKPNEFNPEEQRPFSVQSVDRNGVEVVHDMELLAQYNELQKIDIQELYSEFIQFYHSDLLEDYEGMSIHADGENYFEVERLKRVFADIWANGTSTTFQHDPKYFLFGIIVRDFEDSIESFRQALRNHLREDQRQDQDEDEGEGF
jgi:hypothetical protein